MINIQSDVEIQFMRDAGKVVKEALAIIKEVIKPRITTAELDKLAEEFMEFHLTGFYLKET